MAKSDFDELMSVGVDIGKDVFHLVGFGLRWRDAPEVYGPHKTLYSRWKRWSEKGIFARMMAGLAAEQGEKATVMIDATYLKAHRTATSMVAKKGGVVA